MYKKGDLQARSKIQCTVKSQLMFDLVSSIKMEKKLKSFSVIEAVKLLESKIGDSLQKGLQKTIDGTWTSTKKSQLYRYSLKYI